MYKTTEQLDVKVQLETTVWPIAPKSDVPTSSNISNQIVSPGSMQRVIGSPIIITHIQIQSSTNIFYFFIKL